jgi:WD40 repeat protein
MLTLSSLVLAGCAAPSCVEPQVVRTGGERDRILHLVLSPDGNVAAVQPGTKGRNCSVELIELPSGKKVGSLPAEEWGGLPPVFSPSGDAALVPSGGGFAVHRAPSGELLFQVGERHPHRVWFGDQGRAVLALWSAVGDAPSPGELVSYDAATGKELGRHPWTELNAVVTPDGLFSVAVRGNGLGSAIDVRDATNDKELATAALPEGDPKVLGAWQLVVAPGGARAYVFRDPRDHPEGEVIAFDVPTLRERFRVSRNGWEHVEAPSASHLVLSRFCAAVTLDATTGQVVAEWECGWALSRHDPGELVFSPDGTRAVGTCFQGRSGEFHVWDVATGQRLATLSRNFSGGVLHFFKDNRRVLTRALDPFSERVLPFEGTFAIYRLFDADSGRELARYEPHRSGTGCVTADERRFVWTVGGSVNVAPIPGVDERP